MVRVRMEIYPGFIGSDRDDRSDLRYLTISVSRVNAAYVAKENTTVSTK
jgi:hypothetical protein